MIRENGSKKNISVIIQARYNSSRFPGKFFSQIKKKDNRNLNCKDFRNLKKLTDIIVACTKNKEDDELEKKLVKNIKLNF